MQNLFMINTFNVASKFYGKFLLDLLESENLGSPQDHT